MVLWESDLSAPAFVSLCFGDTDLSGACDLGGTERLVTEADRTRGLMKLGGSSAFALQRPVGESAAVGAKTGLETVVLTMGLDGLRALPRELLTLALGSGRFQFESLVVLIEATEPTRRLRD